MKKYKLIIMLVAIYVFLITIVLSLNMGIKENISFNFDFYHHATGANQLISQKYLDLYNDRRIVYGSEKTTFYPPGFMIWLSVITLMTGINVFYLPIVIPFLFWIFFILLTYLIAKKFFQEDKYVLLSIVLCLLFISGSRFLGFSFLVPPVLGALIIWTIILISLNGDISSKRKIFLYTILISILFITHRPSSLVLILTLIYFIITCILFRNKKTISTTLELISATGFSIVIAYVSYLKTVLIFSQKNFFYGQITLPLSIFNYLILFIFVVSIIIFYIIEEKNEEDHQPRKIKTFYIIISLILVLFFFIFQSNIYSTIIDYLSNLNNISLKFIYDLWINLFVEGEYKHLRFLYYIFFLGIVTILFYLPSILKYNIKSYKNTLITLPLALIFFVFITYYIINMRDERPERIYIYIIPFMIIGAIITLKDLKEKDDKISKKLTILFIVLLFISIAISSVSKVLNLSPHVKDETYYSIKWLKNNIDEKVYAQGSFSQILNSFDINSNGLYSYNIYELRRMKLSSEKEYIIDNKIYKAYTILNQKYGEEIKNKNNKIYSTKNAEIIEYN